MVIKGIEIIKVFLPKARNSGRKIFTEGPATTRRLHSPVVCDLAKGIPRNKTILN